MDVDYNQVAITLPQGASSCCSIVISYMVNVCVLSRQIFSNEIHGRL